MSPATHPTQGDDHAFRNLASHRTGVISNRATIAGTFGMKDSSRVATFVVVLLFAGSLARPVCAGPLDVSFNLTQVSIFEHSSFAGGAGLVVDQNTDTSVPSSNSLAVVGNLSSYSNANADFLEEDGTTTFNWDFEQWRIGTLSAHASFQVTALVFTVDVDSLYDLSGFIAMAGTGALEVSGSVEVYIWARLDRISPGEIDPVTAPSLQQIASEQQITDQVQDVSLILGTTTGAKAHGSFGSLTGSLLAGETYRLYLLAGVVNNTSGLDYGALAEGEFQFTVISVPEPSSLSLGRLAIVGLVSGALVQQVRRPRSRRP